MKTYDAIVLGTGGVGSAALFHLANRGWNVLGLDRFPGGHDRGSSHGQTRLIRPAYFEHPSYVPLVLKAYELWADLEHRQQEQLFCQSGLIEVGPSAGVLVPGVLRSAAEHKLAVEQLDRAEAKRRFPGFVIPEGSSAVFEPRAGFLYVERCVLAHLEQAARAGAELRTDAAVVGWQANGDGVTVSTANEQFSAGRLVVTAGAWAGELLRGIDVQLEVRRKHLHWYACDDPVYQQAHGGCGFLYETHDGYFYGFPQIDEAGVKLAEHSGGTPVADPLQDDRSPEPVDRQRVERFLSDHMPGVSHRSTRHAVCFYTMSPDEHFIVDRHPEHDQVAFAAGLSGHGFKFGPALGAALADLAIDGRTDLPIDFLTCSRFAG